MSTEPIKQKIDEVKAAYGTLKWLVDHDGYNNYLRGLIDAYEAVVDAKAQAVDKSKQETAK